MPSEMLSGPDLGAGFLFQLSLDRNKAGTSFTFHAQDGGEDASGPPIGSPVPLEFLPATTPCQFGGPRCWHRPFVIPPEDTLRVRVAYNRMRFVMQAMMEQVYAGAPVPLESSLAEFVDRAVPTLAGLGAAWTIDRSTGGWLRGEGVAPKSIRIRTTETGADGLSAIWSEFLIEPTGWTELAGGRTVYGGAAFLGSLRSGTRIRWYALPSASGSFVEPRTGIGGVAPRTMWKGTSFNVEPSDQA